MKKIMLSLVSTLTVLSLIIPMSASAQSRDRQERDTGRDITPQEEPANNDGEQGEDGEDGESGNGGGTVYVTNSIIISTHSGGNDESGEDAPQTGNESASASVETVVNGNVVEDVSVNGEEVVDQRSNRRNERHHRYEDRDGDVVVETDIVIVDDEYSESNDSGNQNADGEDGKDGEDGQDGSDGPDVDPVEEEEEEEEANTGRRDRGDRDLGHRGGIAMVWDRVSNFMNNVWSFFFA